LQNVHSARFAIIGERMKMREPMEDEQIFKRKAHIPHVLQSSFRASSCEKRRTKSCEKLAAFHSSESA
jgi:hypothetical protein